MPAVSVALAVHHDDGSLVRAVECLQRQTLGDLEILMVLNGADQATKDAADRVACRDKRIHLLTLEHADLAAALNHAIRQTSCEWVARMDADDVCDDTRLERQMAFASTGWAAIGCAFQKTDATGRLVGTSYPPRDPRESRWRLCLSNPFAHGSMLLRRSAVIEVGGYDESLPRSQDHDLWLRLAPHGVGAVPDVLYTHRLKDHESFASSPMQAQCEAAVLTRAWNGLVRGCSLEARDAIAAALGGDVDRARADLEERMTRSGPTLALLQAYEWIDAQIPTMPRQAALASRESRLREVASTLNPGELWIYGAGAHTAWLLDQLSSLRREVAGIVDDAAAGQERFGRCVCAPAQVPAGAQILLSSDSQEDRLWEASAPLRHRGVRVHRLYK